LKEKLDNHRKEGADDDMTDTVQFSVT